MIDKLPARERGTKLPDVNAGQKPPREDWGGWVYGPIRYSVRPSWRRAIRSMFLIYLLIVLLAGVAALVFTD